MKHLEHFVSRMMRAQRTFDSGMVALIPRPLDAERLAHYGTEALPAEDLHITLRYLGPTINWSTEDQLTIIEAMADTVENLEPVSGSPWAVAHLNPTSDSACSAYIVGGLELSKMHDSIADVVNALDVTVDLPVEHSPWVPHITIGYGVRPETVEDEVTGTFVTFDRIRVGFSEEYTDFYL